VPSADSTLDIPSAVEAAGPRSENPFGPFEPVRKKDAARLLGPYASWPYVERRQKSERRTGPTKWGGARAGGGRRAVGRRRGEGKNTYVDVYRIRDVALAAAVLVLNILDAWLTVLYLAYGGAEANPVAVWMLECGPGWFLTAKSLAVGLCLVFLFVHKTFRFVGAAMRLLLLFYGALLLYHVYLQAAAVAFGAT
jgi:hypothetical protein